MNMRFRHPRQHDDKHLQFLRGLPCIVCGDNTSTEAAHVRYADRSVAKEMSGQRKPDDAFAVPLCGECHREQHKMKETEFWYFQDIDPIKIALALWYRSGDADACAMICANARQPGD